jgi:hypothetical protein
MYRERQLILSLIALGRITPRQAERLLAVSSIGREELWIMGACIVTGLAQLLPPLAHLAQTILPMHHAAALVADWARAI